MAVLDLTATESCAEVVSRLRVAASILDQMWLDATTNPGEDTAIPLGEASQAVHRALMALSADLVTDVRPDAFAVEWNVT